MRILYFADIRFPLERANGIQTAETCHALAALGHDVELVVRPDTATRRRDALEMYGLRHLETLRIRRVPRVGVAVLDRTRYLGAAVRRAARTRAVDVVLTRDLGVAAAVLRVPRRLRVPVVYESHGIASVVGESLDALVSGARAAGRSKQRRLLRRERRVWMRADGYIAITAALAADLTARFGPRGNAAVVPDGVRIPVDRTFVPPFARRPAVVGYAGHFYPWKGVDVLLDALALVPDVRGLLIGGHPAEPDIIRVRARAAALGLTERIEFTGLLPPSAVAGRLVEADILVLPNVETTISATFTSPLKLFEYMAAGRPIIASNLPAIREVLRDGENALLTKAGDAQDLARAIRALAEDPSRAARLARVAWDEAPAYAWAARAERIARVLAAAAGSTVARVP